MPRAPDRDLRRVIVDLAALEPEDLSVVLGDLDAAERRSVEQLLEELSGDRAAPPVNETAPCDLARFSPWVVRRLLSDRFEGEMTVEARAGLAECAAALYPVSASSRTQGRFSRVAGFFRGRDA
jgi:hypothetical protein